MNWINRFLLNMVLLPKGVYKSMGVDMEHLKAILTTKLVMDDRRPNTFHMIKQRTKKEEVPTKSTIGTMIISMIMGLFFLIAFAFGKDPVTWLTFYFSMFIFMLASTLISDFTSVLIDVRDNFIILPKPVNDRTFVTARLLHILVHVCKIILPMTLPAIIVMAILTGFGVLLFMLMIVMSTLFSIFLINAVYLLILKITTPTKFRNIISYIQIVFAIIVYAGTQLGPRMMGNEDYENYALTNSNWLLALPSYWFAAGFQSLYNWHPSALEMIGTVLSIGFPLLSMYVVMKFLAPAFNQKLSMITGTGDTAETSTSGKPEKTNKFSFGEWISKLFAKNKAEQTGFLLTWKITGRSRDFKVKTYPSIGYMVVIAAVFFFRFGEKGRVQEFNAEVFSGTMLMMVYIVSLIVMTALTNIIHSEKFKAAWIYFVTPIEKPGSIVSGAVKALLVKFYLPIVIIILVAGVAVGGLALLPNLLLALINQLLIVYLMIALGKRSLPFSRPPNLDEQGGKFVLAMARLLILGMIGLLHYFIWEHVLLVWALLVISLAVTTFLVNKVSNTEWYDLQVSRDE